MSNSDDTVMEVGQFGITLNKDYKDYDSEDKGKIRNLINIPRHKSFYNQVFQIQQIIEAGKSATNLSSPRKIWEAERNYSSTLASYDRPEEEKRHPERGQNWILKKRNIHKRIF